MMSTFLTNQFNEANGFNFDSTDFAMTVKVSPQVTPYPIPTCEWEDGDDESKEGTRVEEDPDLEDDLSRKEGDEEIHDVEVVDDDDEDEFEQYMLGDDD